MSHCCYIDSCEQCAPGRPVGAWDSYRRIGPFDGHTLHSVGMVLEGATTPWRWSALPGLDQPGDDPREPLHLYWWCQRRLRSVTWLESVRLPEPLSAESRALVQAARGGR